MNLRALAEINNSHQLSALEPPKVQQPHQANEAPSTRAIMQPQGGTVSFIPLKRNRPAQRQTCLLILQNL